MNIIITLPLRFIIAMRSGIKLFEMRKSIPTQFDLQNDIVYICDEVTEMIVGYFTLCSITITTANRILNCLILDDICFSTKELIKYAIKYPTWNLYMIKKYHDIEPRPIKEFGILKPPQSFAYTQVRQAVQ